MYVGRIVALGKTSEGRNAVIYRVSSRSFPNRKAVINNGIISIIPREGFEKDIQRNPYIAYNTIRIAASWAIATNGTHTDPIAEKVLAGVPLKEAISTTLMALDYEKDDYKTPRIVAAVPHLGDSGWLAIVRHDALIVKEVALQFRSSQYLATYEANEINNKQICSFDASTAEEAARYIIEGDSYNVFEKPVTSAAAIAGSDGFELGIQIMNT
ncbi:MAG: IMP cyclohydrolase [SAR202 cluster bacterium]|nr:IMP cyclohydrolase [SAR202 cluster bacterium]|tara:strand:- start:20454 stop:21092 length:639 start_codon:yes stop_codon:yes gene_type:complete